MMLPPYLGRHEGEVLGRDDLISVDVVLDDKALAGVRVWSVSVLGHLLRARVDDIRRG